MLSRVMHEGLHEAARPTPDIWKDCPIELYKNDPYAGVFLGNDFHGLTLIDNQMDQGLYAVMDTSCTVATDQTAGSTDGELLLTSASTDLDWIYVGGASPMGRFPDEDTYSNPFWFEIRLKQSSITNHVMAIIAGLAYDTQGDTTPVVDALLSANDSYVAQAVTFVGWHSEQADADDVLFEYKKTNVAHGSFTNVAAADYTPVADTYVKLGMKYNPHAPESQRISIWKDGAVVAYRTKAQIEASAFPGGEVFTPIFGLHLGSSAAAIMTVDWMYCAAQRPGGTLI